jgi:hypothetical protein
MWNKESTPNKRMKINHLFIFEHHTNKYNQLNVTINRPKLVQNHPSFMVIIIK